MLSRKFILFIFTCCTTFALSAAEVPSNYCNMLKQIHSGMNIEEVFILLGPPHTFGQPPNLDLGTIYSSKGRVTEPKSTVAGTKTEKDLIRQAIQNDPILQAFINASPSTSNVLIWKYEGNKYSIAVQVKGPKVVDVKSNFAC